MVTRVARSYLRRVLLGVSTSSGPKKNRTYCPVELQYVLAALVLVAGIRAFPAPAQNHPLVLIGWKIACSQPLPLKLHLRPDVQIEEMLSAKYKIN